jgi:hypothetical protein
MLATVLCAMIVGKGPEVVSYEYVGKIGTAKATLTIDWPKGSAKKLVPKLEGSLMIGSKNDFYLATGSNKTKGHVEFKILKNKKSFASLRIMRDPKTPKMWIGDYYLPNKKPIPVRLKSMGELEYGC